MLSYFFSFNKRPRRNFAKVPSILEIPNLIEIQKNSYRDFRDQIKFIVGREDVKSWKPNPEGLFMIQNHFGVFKEEMIFMGDSDTDIEAGKNAGIEAYYIDELINLVKKKNN